MYIIWMVSHQEYCLKNSSRFLKRRWTAYLHPYLGVLTVGCKPCGTAGEGLCRERYANHLLAGHRVAMVMGVVKLALSHC